MQELARDKTEARGPVETFSKVGEGWGVAGSSVGHVEIRNISSCHAFQQFTPTFVGSPTPTAENELF